MVLLCWTTNHASFSRSSLIQGHVHVKFAGTRATRVIANTFHHPIRGLNFSAFFLSPQNVIPQNSDYQFFMFSSFLVSLKNPA